uniref:Uncharacterized protein n=1 Tax=Setaria digitata TaxID=48799 RepID=A0A915Q2E1_9BILA
MADAGDLRSIRKENSAVCPSEHCDTEVERRLAAPSEVQLLLDDRLRSGLAVLLGDSERRLGQGQGTGYPCCTTLNAMNATDVIVMNSTRRPYLTTPLYPFSRAGTVFGAEWSGRARRSGRMNGAEKSLDRMQKSAEKMGLLLWDLERSEKGGSK